MRRCYVNKPVRHVPPPPFYPRQTSDTQSAAYLLQRAVTLRHRTGPNRSLYRDPARLASPSLPSPIRRKAVASVHERVQVSVRLLFLRRARRRFHRADIRPSKLPHSRVNGCQHAGCAVFAPRPLRHGHERGNANHRQIRAKRQPLRDANTNAHASKATGAAPVSQSIYVRQEVPLVVRISCTIGKIR